MTCIKPLETFLNAVRAQKMENRKIRLYINFHKESGIYSNSLKIFNQIM